MAPASSLKRAFIGSQIKHGAGSDVIQFIADLIYCQGPEHCEAISNTFRSGYCYYFAHMLKTAFGRGQICWAAPNGHFIWLDEDNNPYDCEGLYFGECETFIPECYLGDAIQDFLHVPGKAYNASKQEIQDIMRRYHSSMMKDKSE